VLTVTEKPPVSVPRQVLVAAPKGFSVAEESYLDLLRNGQQTHDQGWWFNEDTWSEHRYKVRQVVLDPLPDGIYLLQAVQGKNKAQCLIQGRRLLTGFCLSGYVSIAGKLARNALRMVG
jgi:hypothetical protein